MSNLTHDLDDEYAVGVIVLAFLVLVILSVPVVGYLWF